MMSFMRSTMWNRPLACAFALLAFAFTANAAVDGTVTNGTSGKPQPGATVTLFQPTQQGPQFIDSVKSDAEGRFVITKDIPAGGAGVCSISAHKAGPRLNSTGGRLPAASPDSSQAVRRVRVSREFAAAGDA